MHRAEQCDHCGTHPSVTRPDLGGHPDALRVVWRHCRVCELKAQAMESKPPGDEKGWHLVIEPNPNVKR